MFLLPNSTFFTIYQQLVKDRILKFKAFKKMGNVEFNS